MLKRFFSLDFLSSTIFMFIMIDIIIPSHVISGSREQHNFMQSENVACDFIAFVVFPVLLGIHGYLACMQHFNLCHKE